SSGRNNPPHSHPAPIRSYGGAGLNFKLVSSELSVNGDTYAVNTISFRQ
ncbi:unnamed protein product, partial [marine sediment metagenome]